MNSGHTQPIFKGKPQNGMVTCFPQHGSTRSVCCEFLRPLLLAALLTLVRPQPTFADMPLSVLGALPPSLSIADRHACVVRFEGDAFCWGEGASTKLGYGSSTTDVETKTNNNSPNRLDRATAISIPAGRSVLSISTANDAADNSGYSIAVLDNGATIAFGSCASNVCGVASVTTLTLPTSAPIVWSRQRTTPLIVAVSSSRYHSCFLTSTGEVACSGSNDNLQLGGMTSSAGGPADFVSNTGLRLPSGSEHWYPVLRVVQVVTGSKFTCLLYNSGHIACFGQNDYKQCGISTNGRYVSAPLKTVDLGGNVALHMSASSNSVCALVQQSDGSRRVYCWGRCDNRQCFNSYSSARDPFDVSQADVGQVMCAEGHCCLLYAAGSNEGNVRCAGDNSGRIVAPDTSNSANEFRYTDWRSQQSKKGGTSWNGGSTKLTATQLYASSTAMGVCARVSVSTAEEIRCWGAEEVNGQIDSGGDADNPAKLPVPPASTSQRTRQFTHLPVVTSVTLVSANATTSTVRLTYWYPIPVASSLPLQGWVETIPCTQSVSVSSYQLDCTVTSQDLLRVPVWPARFTVSSTGAPAGAAFGVTSCVRPLLDATNLLLTNTASDQAITLPGWCLGTAGSFSVAAGTYTAAASYPSKGKVRFTLPPAAGSRLDVVYTCTSCVAGTLHATSPGNLVSISLPPPVITGVTSTTSAGFIKAAGDTLTISGSAFGTGTSAVKPRVLNDANQDMCSSVSSITDTLFACTTLAFTDQEEIGFYVSRANQRSARWTLSVGKPALTSIVPNDLLLRAGTSYTFFVRGANFGPAAADVTALNVAGAQCSSITYYNSSCVSCVLDANVLSLTSSAVSISLRAWSMPITASLLRILGRPAITAVAPKQTQAQAWVAIMGSQLGLPFASGALSTFGVRMSNVSGMQVQCTGQHVPPEVDNMLGCQLPAGMNVTPPYFPYVTLADGTEVSSPTVSFALSPPSGLVIKWAAESGTPSAIPSSSSGIVFALSPAPVVHVKTDTGTSPDVSSNKLVCTVSSSAATLVGNTSMEVTEANGGTLTFVIGVVADTGSTVSLQVDCGEYSTSTNLDVSITSLYVSWSTHPVNGTLPSAAASPRDPVGVRTAISPAPSIILHRADGVIVSSSGAYVPGGVAWNVPCTLSAQGSGSGSSVSVARGSATSVLLSTSGTASYPGIGIVGAPAAGYTLVARCLWLNGEYVTATSNPAHLAGVSVAWSSSVVAPTTYLYNTPLSLPPIQLLATPMNADPLTSAFTVLRDSSLRSIDLECSVSAETKWMDPNSGALVASSTAGIAGGGVGAVSLVTAQAAVASLRLMPSIVNASANVTLLYACKFRTQALPALPLSLNLDVPSLAWAVQPPVAVVSSSALSQVLLPSMSVRIYRQDGSLLSTDSSTTCLLGVASAQSSDGTLLSPQAVYVGGTVSVTSVAGVATWSSWSLVAPPTSLVTLLVTCTRAQGGLPMSLTANVSLTSFNVSLASVDSLPVAYERALVLPDTLVTFTLSLQTLTPVTASLSPGITSSAFSVSDSPLTTCSAAVDASVVGGGAGAQLGGSVTLYQSVPVTSQGSVLLSATVRAPERSAVPVRFTCMYGDYTIASDVTWLEVAQLQMAWSDGVSTATTSGVPSGYYFNTQLPTLYASLFARVPASIGADATQDTLLGVDADTITATDLVCRIQVHDNSTGALLPTAGGVTQSRAPVGALVGASLSALRLKPMLGSGATSGPPVRIALTCVHRNTYTAGEAVAVIGVMLTKRIEWITLPPASVSASSASDRLAMSAFHVGVYDNATGVLDADDNSTTCVLTAVSGVSATGATLTRQMLALYLPTPSVRSQLGVATFTGVALSAPAGSTVLLQVTCNRAQGGLSMTASTQVVTEQAEATMGSITTLAAGIPAIAYRAPISFSVQLSRRVPISRNSSSPYTVQPYASGSFASGTCSLVVSVSSISAREAAGMSLVGSASNFTSVPVPTSGTLTFTTRVSAPVLAWVPLQVRCAFASDRDVVLTQVVWLWMAPLQVAWLAPPPATFIYNTRMPAVRAAVFVRVPSRLALGAAPEWLGTTNETLALPLTGVAASDLTCSASASGVIGGVQRNVPLVNNEVVSAINTSQLTATLAAVAMQPYYAGITSAIHVTLVMSCTFQRAVALPSINFTSRMQVLQLEFIAPPPVMVWYRGRVSQLRAPALYARVTTDVAPGMAFAADSASTCSLSFMSGSLLDGSSLTSQRVAFAVEGEVRAQAGIVNVTDWWVSAPPQSLLQLRLTCERAEGGPSFGVSFFTAVSGMQVAWQAVDTIDPSRTRTVVLYNRIFTASLRVQLLQANNASSARAYVATAYDASLVPATTCTLMLNTAGVNASIARSAALTGVSSAYRSVSLDASGAAVLNASLIAPAGITFQLAAECRIGDLTIPASNVWPIATSRTTISIQQQPPRIMAPSLRSLVSRFPTPVQVALRDEFGSALPVDDSATCVLTPALLGYQAGASDWQYVDDASSAAANSGRVSLYDAVAEASVVSGVANFTNLALAAPLASVVVLHITCERTAGGDVLSTSTSNISMVAARVEWVSPPPALALYNTPYSVRARLLTTDASGNSASSWVAYSPAAYTATTCTLRISAADVANNVALGGGSSAQSGAVASDGSGTASMRMLLQADVHASASLFVTCEAFGSTVRSPASVSAITQLRLEFVRAPQTYVWPSSNSLTQLLDPAPAVRVVGLSDNSASVSSGTNLAAGIVCRALVNVSATAQAAGVSNFSAQWSPRLVSPPDQGYQVNTNTGIAVLDSVALSAYWGTNVSCYVLCTRSQGDTVVALPFHVSIVDAKVVWRTPPGSNVTANTPVRAEAVVARVDVGGVAEDDNSTSCSLSSTVQLRSGEATARAGVLTYTSLLLVGRTKETYPLYASCTFGDHAMPTELQRDMMIMGCPPGQQPIGGNACGNCPDNSYTDGGDMTCVRCPFGVSCQGGVLELREDYYFTLPPDLDVTTSDLSAYNVSHVEGRRYFLSGVTSASEFHKCWNDVACVVNATERSVGCAEGYTGPLCGVCDADNGWVRSGTACTKCGNRSLNQFVLAVGALLILFVLIYFSLFAQQAEDSKARTVWRILMNYVSALAAFSMYIAKGTRTFLVSVNVLQTAAVPGSGGSLELSPIQCELGLTYYTRFGVIMTFPFLAAVLCVVINIVYVVVRNVKFGWQTVRNELQAFFKTQRTVAVITMVVFMAYPNLTAQVCWCECVQYMHARIVCIVATACSTPPLRARVRRRSLCSLTLLLQSFSMFACRPERIAGVKYLDADLSISCDSAAHKLMTTIAWVCVGLLVGGLPALFAWWLYRHEREVQRGSSSAFFASFGFLYQGYRTTKYVLRARTHARTSMSVLHAGMCVCVCACARTHTRVQMVPVLVGGCGDGAQGVDCGHLCHHQGSDLSSCGLHRPTDHVLWHAALSGTVWRPALQLAGGFVAALPHRHTSCVAHVLARLHTA
ncbi:MAG: hypothetical protein EOO65_00070 [Methanosarcinales archaeon]|nr:MAG: hypothetical protein EOO65_00070 [Methanosarcinales archaeon]